MQEVICHEIRRNRPVFSDRYGAKVDHVDLFAQVAGQMCWVSSWVVGVSEIEQEESEAKAQEVFERFLQSEGRYVCFAAPGPLFHDPFDLLYWVETYEYKIEGFRCEHQARFGLFVFAGEIVGRSARFMYHIFDKRMVQELAVRLLGKLGGEVDAVLNRIIDGEPPRECS